MSEVSLNHLALVVDDLESALRFWCESLGLSRVGQPEIVPDEAVAIAFLQLDSGHLELIQPTSSDSGVAKYLAKRGPGMHHLCLEVSDLDAKLRQLTESGVELINEVPRVRDGWRYAFVHPKSSGGVLLELYERK